MAFINDAVTIENVCEGRHRERLVPEARFRRFPVVRSDHRRRAGLASSYFETITEHDDRMTDEQWKDRLNQTTPADMPWMADLVVR